MPLPILPRPRLSSPVVSGWVILMVVSLLITTAVPVLARQGHAPVGYGATPQPDAQPGRAHYADDWVLAAIRPELRDATVAAMPDGLATYELRATLQPQASGGDRPTLTGSLRLTYVNATTAPLPDLPFRLYANGPETERDAQLVERVSVDGDAVEAARSVGDSVLTVPFTEPLEPGGEAVIELAFTTVLPIDSAEHYGIFGYGSAAGSWALAHWYPVVAGRDPDTGWMLDPPSRNGDPIFADTALFDVTITTEPDWRLATTGVAFGDPATDADGNAVRRFVSGPVRDFTIVADADFEVASGEFEGITVNSWFNPGEDRAGDAVLQYAIQSLALFDEQIAPYPYTEIDLMPVDMQGAAGCEFPGLIYMGLDFYTRNVDLQTPNALDFTVAHEVVHQWFYGLVGNNQYANAYIDEGLTNYLSAQVYFEAVYGEAEADRNMEEYVRGPFERIVTGDGDVVVETATDAFDSGHDYVFAAYVKAPLGFEAIREGIGDDAFFGALEAYVADFAFAVATPDDLLAAFEAASGQDLQALWDTWFTETNGLDPLAE